MLASVLAFKHETGSEISAFQFLFGDFRLKYNFSLYNYSQYWFWSPDLKQLVLSAYSHGVFKTPKNMSWCFQNYKEFVLV